MWRRIIVDADRDAALQLNSGHDALPAFYEYSCSTDKAFAPPAQCTESQTRRAGRQCGI
jgi:hypothetical protein